ncbi:MAG: hypothetical protein JOZ38_12105 [Candidatus Eremiobacteraeota bacterium]|nr:hypothetical protein [Candidatus Eremiobacteraeota bacterium]
MMIETTALLLAVATTIAQTSSPSAAPATPAPPFVDTRGPCMDSAKEVPNVLGTPLTQQSEIVRIDRVISTNAMLPNETIGFLYTRQDGQTWLGMRGPQYTSPASAEALNAVLASTHAPGVKETAFPAQTKMGVKTNAPNILQVQLPQDALGPLGIRLEPCVVWPAGRALPEPVP